MAPKSILVTGCARSGTSATAGLLRKLGIGLGSNFAPANPKNPGGYWEDREWTAIAQSAAACMYGQLQSDYAGPDPNWHVRLHEYMMRRRTDTKLAEKPLWAVKDTVSLILPHVQDCFDFVIMTDRGESETSAARAKFSNKDDSNLHPALRTRFMRRYIPKHDTKGVSYALTQRGMVVCYKGACNDPTAIAEGVAHLLDIPCTDEARTHFDPNLRHVRK